MLEKLGTNYFPGEKFTTPRAQLKMANMIIHALQKSQENQKRCRCISYYTNRIDCIKIPKFFQSPWKAKLRRWYGRQNFLLHLYPSCTNVGGRNKLVVGFPDKEFIDKIFLMIIFMVQDDRAKE